eukprot:Sspe_Gene.12362::Locus_4210_Transcript_1_1_Confidence_1.000_Length_1665::g.12362::m.12362
MSKPPPRGVPSVAMSNQRRPLPPPKGRPATDHRPVERRIDPADGRAYTKDEFVAYYKGLDEWNAARPVSPIRGRSSSPPPLRRRSSSIYRSRPQPHRTWSPPPPHRPPPRPPHRSYSRSRSREPPHHRPVSPHHRPVSPHNNTLLAVESALAEASNELEWTRGELERERTVTKQLEDELRGHRERERSMLAHLVSSVTGAAEERLRESNTLEEYEVGQTVEVMWEPDGMAYTATVVWRNPEGTLYDVDWGNGTGTQSVHVALL